MSESCLVISPPARNEGMQQEPRMGITSRSAVGEVGAVLDPEIALRRNQNPCARSNNTENTGIKASKAPRAVTESATESETSDTEMKGAHDSPLTDRECGTTDRSRNHQKRKIDSMGEPGENEEEGKQGSSGTSFDDNPSLPQHERIHPVEPLDISYCATPQTIRLKEVLLGRLDASTLTGRIQVVSLFRVLHRHRRTQLTATLFFGVMVD